MEQVFKGSHMFDGKININVEGKNFTLETDLGGMRLRNADTSKEIILITPKHLRYNELDTGYVVTIPKDNSKFGLKGNLKDKTFSIFGVEEIIAWGYVDGGLNDENQLHSCQRTE